MVLILDASSGDSIITTVLQMQAGPRASLQARSVTGPAYTEYLFKFWCPLAFPQLPLPKGPPRMGDAIP